MSPQTFVMLMALILVAMAWWANYSKRGKIYCSFIRVDKTSIHKFIRRSSQYVVFDGMRRNVIPKCIVWEDWNKGFIHSLFPATVATLTYSYNSPYPLDPETLQPMILSAEVRKLMNKEEMWRDYNKTLTPGTAKKQSVLQQYLPWVTIGLVALMGMYFYTNMQSFGMSLAEIANRLNAISR